MYTDLFGMKVDVIALESAVEVAVQASSGEASLIVTPNLDHLQRFLRDENFRALYSSAKLVLADGMPIVWLAKMLNGTKIQRITGIDFFEACLVAAEERNIQIGIIGGTQQILDRASERLRAKYPSFQQIYTAAPAESDLENPTYISNLRNLLSDSRPKIVALCLGSPKQEQVFRNIFQKSGIIGVFIGAGATVDFLSGAKRRCPTLLQKLGLEWAFRLALEPKRLFGRYLGNGLSFIKLLVKVLIAKVQRYGEQNK